MDQEARAAIEEMAKAIGFQMRLMDGKLDALRDQVHALRYTLTATVGVLGAMSSEEAARVPQIMEGFADQLRAKKDDPAAESTAESLEEFAETLRRIIPGFSDSGDDPPPEPH